MTNPYYTRQINPQFNERVGSQPLKQEFDRLELAFDQVSVDVDGANEAADDAAASALAAAASAGAASASAAAAEESAEDAANIVSELDILREHYLGSFSADPAMRPDGSPLQAGDWYTNATTGFIRVFNEAGEWVQGFVVPGSVVTSINSLAGTVELPRIISYANRGTLRSNETWAHALVDGLGWFQWVSGSDEPDDDESCFATASGRWLLQAPHWDVVDQWRLPESSARDRQLEDLLAAWPGRVLRGSGVCGITSVATVASTAFAVSVVGAAVGDRVIATPPAALGSTDADSARLSYHAYVSAIDTVAVRLCNASAATATTATAIQTAWPVIVLKEI